MGGRTPFENSNISVCLSAVEIKLETFRYKQTYESYINFSREAKYGILISIRIVYGGLRAYGALLEAHLYCCTMK